jgi:aromatic ring hydroxylase
MGVRTPEEYIESLRQQKPAVYMDGQRIDNLVDHPAFQVGLNSAATTFAQAHDPKYRDLARVHSDLVGEEVNRWTYLMQDL